ncbi:MAG: hypothetical protein JSV24_03455, partial [Bacteroidales bacterium]
SFKTATMKNQLLLTGPGAFQSWTRRKFFKRCTACMAGLSFLPYLNISAFDNRIFFSGGSVTKARVKAIFAYPTPDEPNWPNIGYDFDGKIGEIRGLLSEKCPGIEFIPVSTMDGSAENGKKILNEDPDVEGYAVFHVGCLWGDLTETIASSGKPTVLVDHLYAGSGEFLTSYAAMKRAGHKVTGVSSSDFDDVAEAVNCFDCLHKLKESTILVVGSKADEQITNVYGTRLLDVSFEEMNNAYHNIDPGEAKEVAAGWIDGAEKVIEPTEAEIVKSASIYLAMKNLMQKHNAHAITINCLGGIYSGNLVEAYPCLGFMQLDNDGYVGACEADQRSAMTKLIMTCLAGRPGFISDPVIDTSKNQIIYAHCIGPTRVYGPDGPSNPYHIRSHSEDRKGACNRSLMPLGEMVTTLQFDHLKKQVIFHQGKSAENVDEDMACRTKLAVEVKGDISKLLNYWDQWGWHRVSFFGDLKEPVSHLASLMGFQVLEEA